MFDWREYVELSNELYANGSQAALRSSVSRSYYSAYHHACEYALAHGYSGDSYHQRIIQWFLGSTRTPAEQKLGITLQDLKRLRVDADYRPEYTLTQMTCRSHLADVDKFLSSPEWTLSP